ncbi:MAG: histidine triad nucleotide-binding protein [Clostridiales bacterium]|nr:histidine triad nucleotide-binding protein [Clostridiales bacterium]
MNDCLFCKIISGEIPSKFVYEDDLMVAFNDINPQAPIHLLFVPKKHIESLDTADENDFEILKKMLKSIKKYAQNEGFSEDGYRIVINVNKMGGQEVYHIHFHLVAGRQMQWPPG